MDISPVVKAQLKARGLKVTVNHLHQHTDPFGTRRMEAMTGEWRGKSFHKARARYVTVARLIDRATGTTLSFERAICSPRDTVDRKRGYQIAVGRLLRRLERDGIINTEVVA